MQPTSALRPTLLEPVHVADQRAARGVVGELEGGLLHLFLVVLGRQEVGVVDAQVVDGPYEQQRGDASQGPGALALAPKLVERLDVGLEFVVELRIIHSVTSSWGGASGQARERAHQRVHDGPGEGL